MGRTYTIYAEVRVGDNWYNICPLRKSENGKLTVLPIAEGRSWLKNAADEIEEYSYAHGRPDDLSEELRERFNEDDNADAGYGIPEINMKEHYRQMMCIANYGKAVKKRVKENRSTRYCGYVSKYALTDFEIGESDHISSWIHKCEYDKLDDEGKEEYTYYEWNEWDDWYGVFSNIVKTIDVLLDLFTYWAYNSLTDIDREDRIPDANDVRLIVYCD